MTIKELLNKTPEEIAKVSDEQIKEYFAPYLRVQETESKLFVEDEKGEVDLEQVAEKQRVKKEKATNSKEEWKRKMEQMCKAQGIDINAVMPKGLK